MAPPDVVGSSPPSSSSPSAAAASRFYGSQRQASGSGPAFFEEEGGDPPPSHHPLFRAPRAFHRMHSLPALEQRDFELEVEAEVGWGDDEQSVSLASMSMSSGLGDRNGSETDRYLPPPAPAQRVIIQIGGEILMDGRGRTYTSDGESLTLEGVSGPG